MVTADQASEEALPGTEHGRKPLAAGQSQGQRMATRWSPGSPGELSSGAKVALATPGHGRKGPWLLSK